MASTRILHGGLVLLLTSCAGIAGESGAATVTATPAGAGSATPSASQSAGASPGVDIEGRAEAVIEVEGGPDMPTEGFGSLWLLAPDSETPSLVRLDPESNEIIAAIELPGRLCQGFVVTDDAVWACAPEGAVRIDPSTNQIAGSVTFDAAQTYGRLAFGADAVWALGSDAIAPNTVIRINPATDAVTTIPLGHTAGTLAFGFDALWVTAPNDGLLLRLDPASGEITEHTADLPSPWTLTVGPDSIWVTLHGDEETQPANGAATIARIDPVEGAVAASVATGDPPGQLGAIWAGDDAVWARTPDPFLVRVDPATNEVVETITGPENAGDVVVAFGSAWATAVESNMVYRLSSER